MGRTQQTLASGAALAMLAAPAAAGDHSSWKTVADVGLGGLVATAFGASAYNRDGAGAEQAAFSLGATALGTEALKHIFPEERPNGRDDRSFPSEHTSLSFAAAGYLDERYGWQWGLPAAAVATLVGVARVESKDHHWYDVAAGAALGGATAFAITKPHDSGVRVVPWATAHGVGVSVAARF